MYTHIFDFIISMENRPKNFCWSACVHAQSMCTVCLRVCTCITQGIVQGDASPVA